jgi:hypothetical protein
MQFVAPNCNKHCVGGIDGEVSHVPRGIEEAERWRSKLTNYGTNRKSFLHLILCRIDINIEIMYRYRLN